MLPYDQALSALLWNSVASCRNLRKLYYSPQNGLPTATPKNPYSDKFISQCLERINIWYFKSDMLQDSYNDAWLYESFHSNNFLRYLFINDPESLPRMFCSTKAFVIINKLQTLKVNSGYSDKLAEGELLFYNILNALPKTGRLKVLTLIKYSTETEISTNYSDATEQVAITLRFWLNLSNLTNRRVILYVRFENEADKQSTCIALEQLLNTTDFDGFSFEKKCSCRTILRYQNARVELLLCCCGCANNLAIVW
jgi:hypothetical protein